ncbi:YceG family protein [Bacillus infantis]|uniref:YceG family protein n=1 Tax=Bacillus infantis TaxID=324767 RepID=UPI001CD4068C|nr:YceG family protein [Bacillus infantis]MCA1037032.1 YceG family protein [Bacillus infantis]
MYPTYNRLKVNLLPVSADNWLSAIKKRSSDRPQYQAGDGIIQISQVAARFLGIPADEDEYYNQLYDYIHSPDNGLILLSSDTLDKTIDNQHFQAIQKVLNINREQKLSINRFIAFLDGEQLLLKPDNPLVHRKVREAFTKVIEMFAWGEKEGLESPDFRRVLVDLVKWSFNHLSQPLSSSNPEESMPKYLWYGEASKSQQYFLSFIFFLGCDLAAFSPDGQDVLALADPGKEETFVQQYPEQKAAEPFPVEKRRRKSTVAYKASREIETILNHEGSGLYKPWQLRDYKPSAVTLKTTYDELFILAKEKAMIRPNFEVSGGEVKIPSIFSKINGVSKSRKEYWDRLHALAENDCSFLIRQFPFSNPLTSDFRFHYRNALGKDGKLDPDIVMGSHYWKYGHLPGGLQKGISHAIRNLCAKPELKPSHNESQEEISIYLFTQAMQMPASILKLLQKFDYSQDVPKLILYNNEMNGTMTRSDAALLLLLNQFGVDIIVYNPPGHNDLENYVNEDVFDSHWLEEVVFDQDYKEPSLIKKVFLQGLLKNLKGD